jgi:hypothetical protein
VNVNQRGRIAHATGDFLRSRSTQSAHVRFTSTPAGRNAQQAGIAGSLDERLISDPSLPFPLAPVRQEGAKSGRFSLGHLCRRQA